MKKEIKVYVINASDCDNFRDWERKGEENKIMDKAEELGTVYSLDYFAECINNDDLDLNNSWIFIK
jgi:hypothetical protein